MTMPDREGPYSLETLGALLVRIERDMATKEQIRSYQELAENQRQALEKRISTLETKTSTEHTKLHGRIDESNRDLQDRIEKVRTSVTEAEEGQKTRKWTFAGTALMAAVALIIGLLGLLGPMGGI